MLVTASLLFDLSVLVLGLAVAAIAYTKWSYTYWKRKGVPYLEPKVPFGNLQNPTKKTRTLGDQFKDLYNEIRKRGWKYGGLYLITEKSLLITDLDLLKNVMARDFQYFTERGQYVNEKDDPIGAHLFALGGPKWRALRTKLTPTFSSGKMKHMFPTLMDCVNPLMKVMDEASKRGSTVDIKDVAGRFTTDIIGSCAFGLDFNTFEDPNSPFRVYGVKMFTFGPMRALKTAFTQVFPNLARFLHMKRVPSDISEFFTGVVNDTVKYRETTGSTRKDFLQLMIDLLHREGGRSDEMKFTMDEVVAQSFVFFLAGFETSSTTMTFTLYELSKHQDIQEKLRKEIGGVLAKHGGEFTYESISEMKYLTQVIDESMRIHPPAPFLSRECVKDYCIPDSNVVIEKGTKVIIPIYGIHLDPEYYPEPEKFDPERFSDENKHTRHPFSFMPFGEGPRICIGMRFGMMQTKVGLASIIKNYRLTVNPKTEEPLVMATNSMVLSTRGGVWLNVEKL